MYDKRTAKTQYGLAAISAFMIKLQSFIYHI